MENRLTYEQMYRKIIMDREIGGTMDFIKNRTEKTLFIVPTSIKEKILLYMEQNNLFFPFKLMTLKEVRDSFTFSYNENAIFFIQKKYKVKREIAHIYLENLYYIDESNTINMQLLRNIKKEVEKHNLLLYNPTFPSYLKTCAVVLYGYDILTKYEENLLKMIEEFVPIERVESPCYPLKEAFVCQNSEEEFAYVFEEISSLIEKGVSLDHIYLTNVQEEMYPKLKRFAKAYHIPLQKEKQFLYATPMYMKMKREILEGKESMMVSPYMEMLFAKLNQIENIEDYSLEELMDTFAKEIAIEENPKHYLKIEPLLNNAYSEDDYVFILNANASLLPMTYKDEDFLYDAIKPSFLENTEEKNILFSHGTKKAIDKIKNKTVLFIKEEKGVEYYPSPLLENIFIHEIEPRQISHYSHTQNKKNLVVLLDTYRKYGILSPALFLLKENYSLPYLSYTSTFKGLNKEKLKDYLEGKLLLSYSSLNTFYECSFKYYLEYILRLSYYEENFSALLGTLYHEILKEKPIDIESYINTYLEENKYILSKQEKFYINNNIVDIKEAISFFEDFKEHSSFQKEELETKISISLDSSFSITVMGIIDKKWIEPNSNLAILIDYKTGKTDFQLKDTYYGLHMQLPMYYYLARKNNPEIKIIGFYLEHLLDKNFRYQTGKTEEQQKYDSLKLNGYTLASEEELLKLDQTYQDSRFIKSMRTSSNGFYAYSKILTEERMNNLYQFVEAKIMEMVHLVEEADFVINPKRIRRENISCKFCKYKSICFMEEKDVVELQEQTDISFLGGSAHGKMDN